MLHHHFFFQELTKGSCFKRFITAQVLKQKIKLLIFSVWLTVVWLNCQLNKLLECVSQALSAPENEVKNTLKARAGPLGEVNTVEKKIIFNLSKVKSSHGLVIAYFSVELLLADLCIALD